MGDSDKRYFSTAKSVRRNVCLSVPQRRTPVAPLSLSHYHLLLASLPPRLILVVSVVIVS
jgi:hypothetical protein